MNVIIAKNIVRYRTLAGYTQYELAEKINYSDKSVSKWERGLGLPDIIVLKKMSELFGITVDELISPHEDSEKIILPNQNKSRAKKVLISLMSVGLVWLVATIVYVCMGMFEVSGIWRCFVYAIPASFIVLTVFGALWGNKSMLAVFVSLLIWSVLASIYITFIGTKAWLFFFIGIPLQLLTILGVILLKLAERKRSIKN